MFEKFIGEKCPPCVVSILNENGYSCSATVGMIDAAALGEIESDTNNNLRELIENFSCCNAETYKRQQVFKFLPGHRNFILKLPIEIQKMKQKTSKNRPNSPHERYSKKNTNLSLEKTSNAEDASSIDTESDDTVQQNKADALLLELVEKLGQSSKNKQRQWAIDKSLVSKLVVNINSTGFVTSGSCLWKCPSCAMEYSCKYDRFWRTSNLLKHLESHDNNQTVEVDKENTQENAFDRNLEVLSDDGFNDADLTTTINLCIESLESENKKSPRKRRTATQVLPKQNQIKHVPKRKRQM